MVFLQVMKSIHKLLYILVLWCLMEILLSLGRKRNSRSFATSFSCGEGFTAKARGNTRSLGGLGMTTRGECVFEIQNEINRSFLLLSSLTCHPMFAFQTKRPPALSFRGRRGTLYGLPKQHESSLRHVDDKRPNKRGLESSRNQIIYNSLF